MGCRLYGPIAVSGNPAVLTEVDSMDIDRSSSASKHPLKTNIDGLEDRFTVVSKSSKKKISSSARDSDEPQKDLKANPRISKFKTPPIFLDPTSD